MSGDVRAQIAEALPLELGPVGLRRQAFPALDVPASITGYGEQLLDRLLPVVDRVARQRAADELRAAAEALANPAESAWLRSRADALTAETEP